MKTFSPEQIQQELFDLNFDLKAETFISYLNEETELDIVLIDFFKRRFSTDITSVQESLDKNNTMEVSLSRRSFYNIFPERFFHRTYSATPFVETMVTDYNGRKIEEENARKFFKPLETEFFLQRVAIESAEDLTFKSLGSPELVDFLLNLWQIDSRIPANIAAKILKTMPFMYKIAGDLPLLKLVLENIIEEKLIIEKDYATIATETKQEPWQLGINMATEGKPITFLPKYIFIIDKIRRPNKIVDYMPNGKINVLMNFFLEHTLPYEADFEIKFTLAEKEREFVMSEDVYSGRLGVSATI
ncbi:hypothetical protein [Zobellia laminariae]|uniref:hypothetical protein n=1 Tax=Zobellia laminariae TaxID=248906 RepID=UPI0026F41C77|nr:hypothetical protein [Zobellia laminariae]WKX76146.1 hypothetical protein Q5W13_21680 [Zobellia laminariae]